jgi:hypothetical protein
VPVGLDHGAGGCGGARGLGRAGDSDGGGRGKENEKSKPSECRQQ